MQKQANPTYLKAITIRDPSDIHSIKEDIKKGMILILRVTPLAQKDVEKLRKVVEELYVIARDSNADIARLGEDPVLAEMLEIDPAKISNQLRIDYRKADIADWNDQWNRAVTQ